MHLSEEDLILHYYGEADRDPNIESHLSTCAACQAELAKLQRVLAFVDEQRVPEPPQGFERSMWLQLEPQLPLPRSWLSRWLHWSPGAWYGGPKQRWGYAGGLAALLLIAFVAGRFSTTPTPVAPSDAALVASDRILLVAVVDHLDRSQMVLVELLNGSASDASTFGPDQLRARELVAANRLYRQSAVQSGDELIGETLDELERALLEIANSPAQLAPDDLAALRERIAARGLLFRVRVVQSEMQERERQQAVRVIG
jgi:hypothetical protein